VHERHAEEESIHEKSVAKRTRKMINTPVTKYTQLPGERSFKLYDIICSDESKYKL